VADKFVRGEKGAFVSAAEGETCYLRSLCTLNLDLVDPHLHASVATEGWLAQDDFMKIAHEGDDAFTYAVFGSVTVGTNQSIGTITLNGTEQYKGRMSVYIHVGEEKRSGITHFPAKDMSPGYHDARDEEIFFSVYTTSDRIEWLRRQITERPLDKVQLTVMFNAYVSEWSLGSDTATRHIEADNCIDKDKHCQIVGAVFALASPNRFSAT